MENGVLMTILKSVIRPLAVNVGFLGLGIFLVFSAPAESQAMPIAGITYADAADLALPAPIVAHIRVKRAVRLKGDAGNGVPAGLSRFYVQAEMLSLMKGPPGAPAKVSYLADAPIPPGARAAKIAKKSEYLLFASPVAGRPGELRLTAPDAHIPWSAELGDRVRAILQEASAAGAAPRLTGIGRAFNVPGSLPGESETQIFLQAEDGRPLSLNILRRPGETPRWAVALSDIVDDAALPPQQNTLLWYRLACTLPSILPRQSLAESGSAEASAIRADYALVLEGLGACARARTN